MTQSSSRPSPRIKQILDKVAELTRSGQKSLAVFDLDSTLFDVSPRLERILMDFAAEPANKQRFPDQVKLFRHIKTLRTDWGIQGALIRAGLDGYHPDFQNAVKDYWHERFFSSHYLQYDQPYEGAIDYVKAMAKAGARIAYLTGRDQERMGIGSEEVLQQWDFPLILGQADLVLKPHKSMDDALFKKDWFDEALREGYAKIWFFENEPVNIHLIREHCPEVEVIFMDSTHAGKAEAPQEIETIMNFLCNLET
jgi:hypothetical protein